MPKVNQVIYTLDTIFVSNNIMVLAKAVLQICGGNVSIGLQHMLKKGHNSVKYSENFMTRGQTVLLRSSESFPWRGVKFALFYNFETAQGRGIQLLGTSSGST